MPTTFGDAWKAVKLQVPLADPFLCRKWVQYAYSELADRYPWHFQFAQTIISVGASTTRTGLTVTQGSPTVLDAAAVAGDAFRQFRVGTGPIYTILSVNAGVDYTLDQNYADVTDATAAAVISDRYVRAPADFSSWDTVIDLARDRPIAIGYSQSDLLRWDPSRSTTGEPRLLADLDVDSTGRIRYELWPHATVAESFPARYKIRPAALADMTTLRGVLGDRQDVLVAGALVHASQWPGTEQHRNPYFVLGLNDRLQKAWDQKIHSLGLRDDDQALKSYSDVPWHESRGGVRSTEDLRASDATLDDFF